MEWANQIEKMDRHVADETIDHKRISTIWMGLNHNYFEGEPLLFETMIFSDDGEIYCKRYSTWDEAMEGHKKAVQWVLDGCQDEN